MQHRLIYEPFKEREREKSARFQLMNHWWSTFIPKHFYDLINLTYSRFIADLHGFIFKWIQFLLLEIRLEPADWLFAYFSTVKYSRANRPQTDVNFVEILPFQGPELQTKYSIQFYT